MEPRYETTSTLTSQQYESYTKILQKDLYFFDWFSYLMGGLFLLGGMFLLIEDASLRNKLLIAPAVLLLFAFSNYLREYNAKKLWNDNPAIHDLKTTYRFYDDHFEQQSERSQYAGEYADIRKVLNDEDYLYLMISRSQGFILEKADCSPEMVQFITDKINAAKQK